VTAPKVGPRVGDRFVFRVRPDVVHTIAKIQQTRVGPYVIACCNGGYPADQIRRVDVKPDAEIHCGDVR